MEMFKHVPVDTEMQDKNKYVKHENYTTKCEQMFGLLNEVFDFFEAEYNALDSRKEEFDKFKIKMNAIATIGNALNNKECRDAIEDGYRLYVKENHRLNKN